jgi:hypothetical protein
MSHRTDDGNVGVLLQGKSVLVVLEENDTLSVKLTGDLLVSLSVDIVPDLIVSNTSKWLLKKTHFELGTKDSRNSCVDDLLVQLTSLDKLRNDLETPVTTAHLGIVTSRKGLHLVSTAIGTLRKETRLQSNALVVLKRADMERLGKTSSSTGIRDDIVFVIPFISKDIGKEVRV